MLLALVPAGGHIVTTTDCYRRTRQFIQTVSRTPMPCAARSPAASRLPGHGCPALARPDAPPACWLLDARLTGLRLPVCRPPPPPGPAQDGHHGDCD